MTRAAIMRNGNARAKTAAAKVSPLWIEVRLDHRKILRFAQDDRALFRERRSP
jgi:hypothetical protein